jgi:lysophospholipase L1-like esterase
MPPTARWPTLLLALAACAPPTGASADPADPADPTVPTDPTDPTDPVDPPSPPLPWDDDPCLTLGAGGSWADPVARYTAQDDLAPPLPGQLAVVGSSSIRRWETATAELAPWGVVQRGLGGSRIVDIAVLAPTLIHRHRPAAVLLFAGTNDLAFGATPASVVDAWRCLAQTTRAALGPTPMLFIAITPTPARWANQAAVDATNAAVRALSHPDLIFIDSASAFLATGQPPAADLFVSDGLHLSEAGYALWSDAIVAAVDAAVPRRATGGGAGFEGYIRVDLGPSNPEDGLPAPATDAFGIRWNTWHPARGGDQILAGEALRGLVTTTGAATGVDLVVAGGFRANGLRNGGLLNPPGDRLGTLAVPEATADFFYLEDPDDPGALTFAGLSPTQRYTLRLFASRASPDERRVTRYVARGDGPQGEVTLLTTGPDIGRDGYDGNDGEVAVLTGLAPDAWGQLHLDVQKAEGQFAYLSLLELEAER